MEQKLTILEAYKAMISFLDEYYFRFGQDNLGVILGSIQLRSDQSTADPAAWQDWIEAVNRVLDETKR